MKTIACTPEGMEDVAAEEIREITGAESSKICEGRLLFDITLQKAKELAYATRSLFKVYGLVKEIEFSDLEDLKGKVGKVEVEDPFVVRCHREGEHSFESLDAEKEMGEVIYEQGHKVDLKNPKTIVIADITGNTCYLGKLIGKEDLSRRDYKIKAHPKSVNACLAYGAVRLSGWTREKTLLDPSCKDGVIAIEAALWASKVPRGYFERGEKFDGPDKKIDKQKLRITAADSLLPNVRSAEINAKLAEVRKLINFTKYDMEWIDLKFEEGEVDYIVTNLIGSADELFARAEDILAENGRMLIITQRPQNVNTDKFKLESKREVKVHKARYTLLIFKYP